MASRDAAVTLSKRHFRREAEKKYFCFVLGSRREKHCFRCISGQPETPDSPERRKQRMIEAILRICELLGLIWEQST
jgi:hypothetical protein